MKASGYARAENDYYCEPTWCVDALLDVEEFRGECWDPACGGGNIPRTMEARGIACRGSDIVDRGYGSVANFLVAPMSNRVSSIVSNPPYGILEQFVLHALDLTTDKVAVLARLAFLEGQGRQQLFATAPLARVWVSSRRISMPPGGTNVKARGGSEAYGWFVFSHRYCGHAELRHLPLTAAPHPDHLRGSQKPTNPQGPKHT